MVAWLKEQVHPVETWDFWPHLFMISACIIGLLQFHLEDFCSTGNESLVSSMSEMAISSPTRAAFICCRQRKLCHVGLQRADSTVEGSMLTHLRCSDMRRALTSADEPGTSLHSCSKNIQLTYDEECWEAYVIFWHASFRWTILIMKWMLTAMMVAWLVAWLIWRKKTCLKVLNQYKSL